MKKYLQLAENEKQLNKLKIEIRYNLGGTSWATYRPEPRGYYLHVTPIKREERGGMIYESFGAFTGAKCFLLEVSRKSASAEAKAEAIAEAEAPAVIDYVLRENGLHLAEAAEEGAAV